MTTYKTNWNKEHMWQESWQEEFPAGVPVAMPSGVAQWMLRTFPLAGNLGFAKPVIKVGRWLFLLWFAGNGQWWVVRLGVSS
jgi:hypothetical protein